MNQLSDRDKLIYLQECVKKLASLAQADFKEASEIPPGDGDRLLARSYTRSFLQNMQKAGLITGFKEDGKDVWVSFDLQTFSCSAERKASKSWRTVPVLRTEIPDAQTIAEQEA